MKRAALFVVLLLSFSCEDGEAGCRSHTPGGRCRYACDPNPVVECRHDSCGGEDYVVCAVPEGYEKKDLP